MINIGSNYTDLFGSLKELEDSTDFDEFKTIFLPPDDFVCKFNIAFKYYPRFAPMYPEKDLFIHVYVPDCIPDNILDGARSELNSVCNKQNAYISLVQSDFNDLVGLIGGDSARLMDQSAEFSGSDLAFMPLNMLTPMFLVDQTQYPNLCGDLSCEFTSSTLGIFNILDASLNVLNACAFSVGWNSLYFSDTSGFFAFSVDSTQPTIISDLGMYFTPDEYSDPLPTVPDLLASLNSTIYEGL